MREVSFPKENRVYSPAGRRRRADQMSHDDEQRNTAMER